MTSLSANLQKGHQNLAEFGNLAKRVLDHIPNVITETKEVKGFKLLTENTAGTKKHVRPVNIDLFLFDRKIFSKEFDEFRKLLKKLSTRTYRASKHDCTLIDRVTYTMQQSVGIGLDLLSNPNSARKHVGNRFEELIRAIILELEIPNNKIVLKIPYGTGKTYSCETDLVFSPHNEVKSNKNHIDSDEIVISLKTTSKDRLGKIFMDKLLMKKFNKHEVKVIGIFLNDIQRKGTDNISYTFVSGLFMVYTKFLTKLDGVYFVDLPPSAKKAPFNDYISTFSQFITKDIWKLIK